jgi:thiamine biosynthesis lipoprotein ApbE
MNTSDELWDAINVGKIWNTKTLGVFDITAAPLIKIWKSAGKNNLLPSVQEIKTALEKIGVENIIIE